MKILLDFKIFSQQKYGGPSRYFFNLFEKLNMINNDAYVLSPLYCNNYLSKSNFKKNIFGIYLPQIKYLNYYTNIINKNFSFRSISKIKPQILHTTDYFYAKSDSFRPLVVTVHDLIHEIFHYEFGKKKDYRPKKRILDLASHIISVSNNTKKDLINIYKINPEKISVIHHGNSFHKSNDFFTNEIDIDSNFFLYIGSRKRYKNFISLIKAFKKNKEIYNTHKIICVGGGNLLNSEIKKLKEENIDLKKIIFYPSNDDNLLYNLYKKASALIYPSLYEGFGMPIVEAMSLGCPVICSNTSSLPEVYGNAALTFCPSSENELSKKMEEITFDSACREKIINLGFNQSKNFSWEKCAKETLSVYKKII